MQSARRKFAGVRLCNAVERALITQYLGLVPRDFSTNVGADRLGKIVPDPIIFPSTTRRRAMAGVRLFRDFHNRCVRLGH
jgi:hypothetical protein